MRALPITAPMGTRGLVIFTSPRRCGPGSPMKTMRHEMLQQRRQRGASKVLAPGRVRNFKDRGHCQGLLEAIDLPRGQGLRIVFDGSLAGQKTEVAFVDVAGRRSPAARSGQLRRTAANQGAADRVGLRAIVRDNLRQRHVSHMFPMLIPWQTWTWPKASTCTREGDASSS